MSSSVRVVDRRADVWAFGCVLYEMLTGNQPFPNGETLTDTLAGILVREPDLQALPAATPPKIRALVERCLRKDERRRIRDMGDAGIGIEEARSEAQASIAAAAVPGASRRRELLLGAFAALFLLASVGVGARFFLQTAPATALDKSRKETAHRFPQFLPDGRRFMYLATGTDARDRTVYVGSLDSKERHPLPGIAAEVKYSSGHVVFVRDGALRAQPFDVKRAELAGEAFAVADKFAPPTALTWPFSVSLTGALSYRPASDGASITANAELVWYDRKGSRLALAGVEGDYPGPELSPDGKFVAFARGTPADIWWLDIEKNLTTKLTTDPASDQNPRWSPDGKTIGFDSPREGGANIYTRAVGVTAADKLVFKGDAAKALSLSDWSSDGRYLAYVADNDVWAVALTGEPKPIQVTKSSFIEGLPRISPDSRWISYVFNKSGQNEVYIQSFPEPGVEQQVSTGAGSGSVVGQVFPRWCRDGKELFYYVTNPPRFISVSIKPAGTSLNAAAPKQIFPHPRPSNPFSSIFSVSADGRFLMQLAPSASAAAPGASSTAPPGATVGPTIATLILNFAANRK